MQLVVIYMILLMIMIVMRIYWYLSKENTNNPFKHFELPRWCHNQSDDLFCTTVQVITYTFLKQKRSKPSLGQRRTPQRPEHMIFWSRKQTVSVYTYGTHGVQYHSWQPCVQPSCCSGLVSTGSWDKHLWLQLLNAPLQELWVYTRFNQSLLDYISCVLRAQTDAHVL